MVDRSSSALYLVLDDWFLLPYFFQVLMEPGGDLVSCEVRSQTSNSVVGTIVASGRLLPSHANGTSGQEVGPSVGQTADEVGRWMGFRPSHGFKS